MPSKTWTFKITFCSLLRWPASGWFTTSDTFQFIRLSWRTTCQSATLWLLLWCYCCWSIQNALQVTCLIRISLAALIQILDSHISRLQTYKYLRQSRTNSSRTLCCYWSFRQEPRSLGFHFGTILLPAITASSESWKHGSRNVFGRMRLRVLLVLSANIFTFKQRGQ